MRVVIGDERNDERKRLREQMEAAAELELVGEATSDEALLALVHDERPDVAVIEIRQYRLDGIRVMQFLKDAACPTRFLVHSDLSGGEFAGIALAAGASGYVSKQAPPSELLEAVRVVAEGGFCVSRDVACCLAQVAARQRAAHLLPSLLLEESDLDLVVRFARGESAQEVAHAHGTTASEIELRWGGLRETLEQSGLSALLSSEARTRVERKPRP